MKTLIMIIRRNMLVYSRDKATVFFSMLAMIIVILLNVIFLGKNNVDNLMTFGNINSQMANEFIIVWIIAGIIAINCVTSSLAVMNIMVEDEDKKRMPVFLVSSVSRFKLSLAYILTAFLVSFGISSTTFCSLQIYLFIIGEQLFTIIQVAKIIGIIFLNSFASSTFMFFLVSFIHTASAYSGINTLISTLIGFVTGMYVSMGELPIILQKILKFIPAVHGVSLIREAFLENVIKSVFVGQPTEVFERYLDYMGITLSFNGTMINDSYKVIILLITGIIFLILSGIVIRNKEVRDR
ncbi:MAG: ABC transporter permease [Clostridium butyricum]|nr:ABC transporter permease [Clostridium butyricum]